MTAADVASGALASAGHGGPGYRTAGHRPAGEKLEKREKWEKREKLGEREKEELEPVRGKGSEDEKPGMTADSDGGEKTEVETETETEPGSGDPGNVDVAGPVEDRYTGGPQAVVCAALGATPRASRTQDGDEEEENGRHRHRRRLSGRTRFRPL
jgi:hypothetical protein